MFFAVSNISSSYLFIAMILAYLFALLIGFSMHEAAHAFAAVKQGDPTPKLMGRLTLNPIRHIDPLGFIMLLLVGFGYAKPVPVNPYNFKNGRWSDFLVSIAGIGTNLLIAVVLGLFRSLFVVFSPNLFYSNNFFANFLVLFLEFGMIINLCLAFFNLIPVPPLDGFRVLEAILGPKHRNVIDFMEKYSFVIMIVFLIIVMFVFNFIGYLANWSFIGICWIFEKFFYLFV